MNSRHLFVLGPRENGWALDRLRDLELRVVIEDPDAASGIAATLNSPCNKFLGEHNPRPTVTRPLHSQSKAFLI